MKKHLRTFINHQQDDWSDTLFMAEFVANNNNFIFIKLSPFFASRDLYTQMSFDVIDFSDITMRKQINKKIAIDISKTM